MSLVGRISDLATRVAQEFAVARRNSASISVRDLGAVGDGVTDDTAAIQSALSEAHARGGGTVTLPAGTYAISTFLVARSNVRISAYGAHIKSVGGTGILRNFEDSDNAPGYSGEGHIVVEGGIWDGNAYNGTDGTTTATTNIMNFVHGHDITVRDAVLRDASSAHAIEFNSTNNGTVEDCVFEGFHDNTPAKNRQYSEAVQIDAAVAISMAPADNTPSANITVRNSVFRASDRCGVWGRAVGSHTFIDTAPLVFSGIKVVGNTIEGALTHGIRGFQWWNSNISGNIIHNVAQDGIFVSSVRLSDGPVNSPYESVVISENLIRGHGEYGIRVEGGAGAAAAKSIDITGNQVEGSASNKYAIAVSYVQAGSVTENTVRDNGGGGVSFQDSVAPVISGNQIINVGTNAINISGSSSPVVSSNRIIGTTSNNGIYTTNGTLGNSTNGFVVDNYIEGQATNGIRLAGSSTGWTIRGNRVRGGTSGVSLSAGTTGAWVVGNDLSGNGWTGAAAILPAGSSPRTGFSTGTSLPGDNRV